MTAEQKAEGKKVFDQKKTEAAKAAKPAAAAAPAPAAPSGAGSKAKGAAK